jgi:hypothetical protein
LPVANVLSQLICGSLAKSNRLKLRNRVPH